MQAIHSHHWLMICCIRNRFATIIVLSQVINSYQLGTAMFYTGFILNTLHSFPSVQGMTGGNGCWWVGRSHDVGAVIPSWTLRFLCASKGSSGANDPIGRIPLALITFCVLQMQCLVYVCFLRSKASYFIDTHLYQICSRFLLSPCV